MCVLRTWVCKPWHDTHNKELLCSVFRCWYVCVSWHEFVCLKHSTLHSAHTALNCSTGANSGTLHTAYADWCVRDTMHWIVGRVCGGLWHVYVADSMLQSAKPDPIRRQEREVHACEIVMDRMDKAGLPRNIKKLIETGIFHCLAVLLCTSSAWACNPHNSMVTSTSILFSIPLISNLLYISSVPTCTTVHLYWCQLIAKASFLWMHSGQRYLRLVIAAVVFDPMLFLRTFSSHPVSQCNITLTHLSHHLYRSLAFQLHLVIAFRAHVSVSCMILLAICSE
jgi:hypothetical protein